MKWEIKDISGKKVKEVDLPDEIFGLEMNEHVLHTVSKAWSANQRQGTHSTKTRGFVSGGNKKPFKQKGTGNARQGSGRSPLFPGGAVVHGPQPRSYRQDVNTKTKRLAVKVALSDKVRHDKLVLVDSLPFESAKTKSVIKLMKDLGCSQKALFSDERKDDFLFKSARNVQGTNAVAPADLNVVDLLRHESVVITENALNALVKRLGGKA